jgi:phage terminase large subunit-like protein
MSDRATAYAESVVIGKVTAGPHVRDACARHLRDLVEGPARGLFYDEADAAHRIAFIEECLCLNGSEYEGKPFLLQPWQDFIIGSLFGWKKTNADGPRRFRVAYIETAKGSGKSPLAAAIGHIGLIADNESRAEIYAAATSKDQAAILFKDAVAMWEHSPELQSRLVASGGPGKEYNLAYLATSSFFRTVSADKKKSGLRPHMALLDEIHEAPNGNIIEMLRAGFKSRRQPLSVMITNSGCDMTSVCWEYHELAAKVAAGTEENDEFFSYVCAMDEEDLKDDRFLDDETCWVKSNPSINIGLPGLDYIRGQVREARGLPSKMSLVKRLNFNVWTESEDPWISKEVWQGCDGKDFDEQLLDGRKCFGGLDLSSTQDLTSLVLLFEPIELDPIWRMKSYFWLPGDNLKRKSEHDHVPYQAWKEAGWLYTFPGTAVNKSAVIKKMYEISLNHDLVGVAYDRAGINSIFEFAEKAGIELALGKWNKEKREWEFDSSYGIKMMPFGQEARSMSPALSKFEGMLLNVEVMHDGNPVLQWCAANSVVTSDEDGYRKISKRKSSGRVDGIISSIMACGICASADTSGSVYEERLAQGGSLFASV